jgi:hypothetical protein
MAGIMRLLTSGDPFIMSVGLAMLVIIALALYLMFWGDRPAKK